VLNLNGFEYKSYKDTRSQIDMDGNLYKYIRNINNNHFQTYIVPRMKKSLKKRIFCSFDIVQLKQGSGRTAELYKIKYSFKEGNLKKNFLTVL
jgi:hypothetical protein